ncbi:MAG: chemotaxis protein CheW [Acidobacteria bacterium]|nr:MAG: chemotaxis protein CheW [Acidobacteriota bacterium]
MSNRYQLVVFTLGEQRYALKLDAVERVLRAAEISPLPNTPEIVMGVINIRGQIVPVINTRRRFLLPEREISLTDLFIMARTSKRNVVLVADAVNGLVERSERDVVTAEEILGELECVEGVMKLDDGLVFIHDLERCLSLEEERMLDDAMGSA